MKALKRFWMVSGKHAPYLREGATNRGLSEPAMSRCPRAAVRVAGASDAVQAAERAHHVDRGHRDLRGELVAYVRRRVRSSTRPIGGPTVQGLGQARPEDPLGRRGPDAGAESRRRATHGSARRCPPCVPPVRARSSTSARAMRCARRGQTRHGEALGRGLRQPHRPAGPATRGDVQLLAGEVPGRLPICRRPWAR
jgi:hypothetical protein